MVPCQSARSAKSPRAKRGALSASEANDRFRRVRASALTVPKESCQSATQRPKGLHGLAEALLRLGADGRVRRGSGMPRPPAG